ncbi:phosphatase PAP2 family protein [Rheinheimera sp.]|uniref:phosphatase PAP2 family protein n=1 Tax=Rheinheimera sp. TaxID=1869214 RepID=UPI00307F21EF
MNRPRLFGQLIALPTLLFMLAFSLFYVAGYDFALAGFYYRLEGQHWALQQHWVLQDLLHSGARQLNSLMVLAVLVTCIWRVWQRVSFVKRKAGFRLLLSLLCCFGLVALVKKLLPAACPWDLQQFGGTQVFTRLWDSPAGAVPGQCFPAGHASVGFGWMALYFYWRDSSPALARTALIGALMVGTGLGLVQQLRGAHFISHDITTAWLCWCCCSLIYALTPDLTEQHAAQTVLKKSYV